MEDHQRRRIRIPRREWNHHQWRSWWKETSMMKFQRRRSLCPSFKRSPWTPQVKYPCWTKRKKKKRTKTTKIMTKMSRYRWLGPNVTSTYLTPARVLIVFPMPRITTKRRTKDGWNLSTVRLSTDCRYISLSYLTIADALLHFRVIA